MTRTHIPIDQRPSRASRLVVAGSAYLGSLLLAVITNAPAASGPRTSGYFPR